MYETFEKLPESKRKQIMEACVSEFARNGYRNASTNAIVNSLGISKGVLFLYFKSKKNLYLYLIEHYSKILVEEFFLENNSTSLPAADLFDNLGEFYKKLLQERPEIFVFLLDAFIYAPSDIREEVEESHNRAHGNVFQYIKKEGFREGVDLQMVIDMLHMVSFFVGQQIFSDYKDQDLTKAARGDIINNIEKYEDTLSRYIDIIKYGVYQTPPEQK